jgi:hypothetical protein
VRETVAIEYSLSTDWDLGRLQVLFGLSGDDPMFDSFPIGAREAAALAGSVNGSIRLDLYEFFLEADSE